MMISLMLMLSPMSMMGYDVCSDNVVVLFDTCLGCFFALMTDLFEFEVRLFSVWPILVGRKLYGNGVFLSRFQGYDNIISPIYC